MNRKSSYTAPCDTFVRRLCVLVLLCLLTVVACAGTPEPALRLPTVPAVTPTPTTVATPPATVTGAPLDLGPSPPPPFPTPTTAAESPWPHLVREFDLGIPAGNSYSPRALALHPGLGRLYVRTHTRDFPAMGLVTAIDLDTGEVLAVVETGPDSYSDGPLLVDAARNRLYVLNPGDLTLSILDAETLEPVGALDGVNQLTLDADGQLYVADDTSLRLLDPAGYGTLQRVSLGSAKEYLALAADRTLDRLWLAVGSDGRYWLKRFQFRNFTNLPDVALPGRPDDLVFDAKRGRVHLSLSDGEHNLLWTLDRDGELLEERVLGAWTQHTTLALDPDGDRLFLGRDVYRDYGLTVLDLESGQQVADIPLEHSPNALAWDAEGGRLFASHTYADRVSLVDVDAGNVVAVYPTALDLVDLAVDAERGRLFATDSAGRLRVLDSQSGEELATLSGAGRIALDSAHGRLYTGGEGADRVRLFDADSLAQTGEIQTRALPVADAHHGGLYLVRSGVYLASLETMTITRAISDTLPQNPGFSPNPAAVDAVVDPGSGRLFAIINNGVPGSNNGNYLYAYKPVTYRKTLTDTERSPVYLDVDPATGRAYVSRIHMTLRSTGLLEGGREYTARLDGVFGALRVDPGLERVYLSVRGDEAGHLLVLDAATLDALGSVPIPGGLTLRALDPRRHRLYLASDGGRVQVWSATGGTLPQAAGPVPADLSAEGPSQLLLPPDEGSLWARDNASRLFRSDDGGESWGRVGGGLPDEGVLDVAFSPDMGRDRTLFAALATADQGFGVWQSDDGGKSWRMTSVGLTDLAVTDLVISPAFARDRTLFAITHQQGLFRSTDGGETWVRLTERYRPQDAYEQPPGELLLSPTYGQDQTLFFDHYGLQRSTDGGETWQRVQIAPKPEGYGWGQLVLAADYATSRALTYIWVPDEADRLTRTFRSTDGGRTWAEIGVGLALSGYGRGRALVSPDGVLYLVWTPATPGEAVGFLRSRDLLEGAEGVVTWEALISPPPQAATPIELTRSGAPSAGAAFVALDGTGKLVRWPVAELQWQAIPGP